MASFELQAALLRFLESGEIQRVGFGSRARQRERAHRGGNQSRPVGSMAENLFREDLYYRLNVIRIAIPPLRERSDDVLQLVMSNETYRVPRPVLENDAAAKPAAYS